MNDNVNDLCHGQIDPQNEVALVSHIFQLLAIMAHVKASLTIELPVARHVESPVLSAAGHVLLGGHAIDDFQGLHCEVLCRDILMEVKGDIVHEETLELSLQPQSRLLGLHVDVQRINVLFLCKLDVGDQGKGLHVDGDANPFEYVFFYLIV